MKPLTKMDSIILGTNPGRDRLIRTGYGNDNVRARLRLLFGCRHNGPKFGRTLATSETGRHAWNPGARQVESMLPVQAPRIPNRGKSATARFT